MSKAGVKLQGEFQILQAGPGPKPYMAKRVKSSVKVPLTLLASGVWTWQHGPAGEMIIFRGSAEKRRTMKSSTMKGAKALASEVAERRCRIGNVRGKGKGDASVFYPQK
jgi:hypothetical protein